MSGDNEALQPPRGAFNTILGQRSAGVELNDSDNTKRVREAFGLESKYWITLPESAQS